MNEYVGELFSALAYPPFVGMVARAVVELFRDIESLPPPLHFGGASRRGRMGESDVSPLGERQVDGLFESLLVQSFNGESWIKN
jgi:hypothetical protein